MEAVAAMMQVCERTLRRKLDAEGTSFGQIADDVRASLAVGYLKTTRMTTEDVAALLGFGDAAGAAPTCARYTAPIQQRCHRLGADLARVHVTQGGHDGAVPPQVHGGLERHAASTGLGQNPERRKCSENSSGFRPAMSQRRFTISRTACPESSSPTRAYSLRWLLRSINDVAQLLPIAG